MDYAQYFTNKELQRIHDASLEILEDIGILVHNEKARRIYKEQHGCLVDEQSGLVKFPAKVVEKMSRVICAYFIPLQHRILNTIKFCPMTLPWL